MDAGSNGLPPDAPARVRLRFLPDGGDTRVPSGTTVFDAASWNAIAIDSTCGGHGTCKKCRVRIVEGDVSINSIDMRAFSTDELRDGWRLSCRAEARVDLVVDVPPLQTRPKAAMAGVGRQVILRPAIQKRYVELREPSLEDQQSDIERLLAALDDLEPVVEMYLARRLPHVLRASDYKVTAVIVDGYLIDVEPGDTTERRYALAFDLGTTTVVATLLDVGTGQPLAVRSMLNMQQPFGADVISRVSATMMDEGALALLEARAHDTLDQLAGEVCDEAGIARAEVHEIVVAGNQTMTQLALGVDPEPLAVAPFIVVARHMPRTLATDYGVKVHERAPAWTFPTLGAYVGGDIVAGMLATGLTRDRRLRLFIDVGTNCEIALGSSAGVVCTAAPAGPAFEAAQIRCGMRAADGAIEGVRIKDGDLELEVIGDAPAVGICGSGLVDAVAELARIGLLDRSGRFLPDVEAAERFPLLATRLVALEGGERVFVLVWGASADPTQAIFLSQRDVRELQFAKASVATGWRTLMREIDVEPGDVQQVLLAGSFGSYLSPASAVRIGLVPKLALTRIMSAGNVAGEGAKIAALSVQERAAALALLDEVRYVELSGRDDFQDVFIDELGFPA